MVLVKNKQKQKQKTNLNPIKSQYRNINVEEISWGYQSAKPVLKKALHGK